MTGMTMKKSAQPSANVGETYAITGIKGEETTTIVGGATVPSQATRIIVMTGRGA